MLSLKSAGDGTGFVMEALGQFSVWIYQERHRMCICMCMKGGGCICNIFFKTFTPDFCTLYCDSSIN